MICRQQVGFSFQDRFTRTIKDRDMRVTNALGRSSSNTTFFSLNMQKFVKGEGEEVFVPHDQTHEDHSSFPHKTWIKSKRRLQEIRALRLHLNHSCDNPAIRPFHIHQNRRRLSKVHLPRSRRKRRARMHSVTKTHNPWLACCWPSLCPQYQLPHWRNQAWNLHQKQLSQRLLHSVTLEN